MEDDPIRAVMTKRKSSIVLACRAIKKGNADAFFSAGSTGAMTAAATAYVTPFRYLAEGKKQPVRPCLTNALPNRAGGLTVLCDMGANPDVTVDDMVRFAQMGAAYARVVLDIEHPRVGLLANGTEDEKGSNFTKACFPAMKAAVPGFVGNCEGTDLTSGNFDVVVADGMSGNIALKATEALPSFCCRSSRVPLCLRSAPRSPRCSSKSRCARLRPSFRATPRAARFCWACAASC